MNPNCDTSILIQYKVGELAANIEAVGIESIGGLEINPLFTSKKNIETIERLPPELTDRVARLLQNMNPLDAIPFLRSIAVKHPQRFALMVKNDVIASRLHHTRKIAELCALFDPRKIMLIQSAVNTLRRQVFEIESEYNQSDIHSKIVNNITAEDDDNIDEDEGVENEK